MLMLSSTLKEEEQEEEQEQDEVGIKEKQTFAVNETLKRLIKMSESVFVSFHLFFLCYKYDCFFLFAFIFSLNSIFLLSLV